MSQKPLKNLKNQNNFIIRYMMLTVNDFCILHGITGRREPRYEQRLHE